MSIRLKPHSLLSMLLLLAMLLLLPAREVAAAPRVVLQVDPPAVALEGPAAEQQLLVTALHPDGRREDVTRAAVYRSPGAWLAAAGGRVRAGRDGRGVLNVTWKAGRRVVGAAVVVTARNAKADRPPSFVNEVIPALTQAGCNQGACHGGQSGRGGFRLSLFGFDPRADYAAIAREAGGRRVTRAAPERSLLLLKGMLALPHGGGKRLAPGTAATQVLRRWLAAGAPGPLSGERTVTRIEVFPAEQLLRRGQAQQLRVTAHYSDGSAQDVTRLARYTSANEAIVAVADGGLARGGVPGAASVMVRCLGQAAVARVALPYGRAAAAPELPAANYVDTWTRREWRRLGLHPSPPATDTELLRRTSLDLTGTLPTAAQVEAFVKECGESGGPSEPSTISHQPSTARTRLIDRLLASPEWVDFWTLYFSDQLRNTQRALGEKGMWGYHNWIRAGLRQEKPYNEMVRELVAGRGSASRSGAAYFYNTAKTPEDLAELTGQVFLGVRLQCARCHNHPFDRWTQADYYGLAAFFPGVKRKQSGEELLILHTPDGAVQHPRTGQPVEPFPPDGPVQRVPGADRPAALANWLADGANPFVARNIVNRIWARLMGRGLIEPVDDVRVSNPATHPELLDALTRDFVAHGYSLKHLMRVVVSSQTYGLSSRPTALNAKDDRFYSHRQARRLMAEQLMDGIGQATGQPEKFPNFPAGTRAIALPDPALAPGGVLTLFGLPPRATSCECERSDRPNLGQTLFMINSEFSHNKVVHPQGVVAAMLAAGKSDEEIVRHLYASTLSRYPTADELVRAGRFITEAGARQEGLEDVLWTLLNSQEFLLNH